MLAHRGISVDSGTQPSGIVMWNMDRARTKIVNATVTVHSEEYSTSTPYNSGGHLCINYVYMYTEIVELLYEYCIFFQ